MSELINVNLSTRKQGKRRPVVCLFAGRPRQIEFRAKTTASLVVCHMPFTFFSSHRSHCSTAVCSKAAERAESLFVLLCAANNPAGEQKSCLGLPSG